MEAKTREGIIRYMKEQDVRFVRLAFCDIFGQLKNVTISASFIEKALERGVAFNAAAVRGFMNIEESDLIMVPDLETLTILPWRPADGKVARFFCSIQHSDGRPFEGDVRTMLKEYERSLAEAKTDLQVRTECEFYLFKRDADGNPTGNIIYQATYAPANNPTAPSNPRPTTPATTEDPVEEEPSEIDENDTPLSGFEVDPEEDEPVAENDTPLAGYEEEPDEELSDEAMPFSPFTGDARHTAVWSIISVLSLLGIVLVARKRREE